MAKYFSTKKTSTNGYTFADLALYLSKLKGAEKIFTTDGYKIMIRDSAVLFADKSRPCYLDLSMLVNKKGDAWNTKLFTASEFISDVNKDIFRFQQERAKERAMEL